MHRALRDVVHEILVRDLVVAVPPVRALAVVVLDDLRSLVGGDVEAEPRHGAAELVGVELARAVAVPEEERLAQDRDDRAADRADVVLQPPPQVDLERLDDAVLLPLDRPRREHLGEQQVVRVRLVVLRGAPRGCAPHLELVAGAVAVEELVYLRLRAQELARRLAEHASEIGRAHV